MLEQYPPPIEKLEQYGAKTKLFGEAAERIQRAEYESVVAEILTRTRKSFQRVEPVEQLADKESFGDIDLVCLKDSTCDRTFFEELFGEDLIDYHRNGPTYSTLLRLSEGKQVHVDFISAQDEKDFERQMIYFSKGHLSSIIGMMAKKLNFKYGTEGFFKRFKDSKGNWHNILVSSNLRDGMRVLGFDPEKYGEIQTVDDTLEFVVDSSLFDSSFFEHENLARRDRESVMRVATQHYLVNNLAVLDKRRALEDEDALFKQYFPQEYEEYLQKVDEVNRQIEQRAVIDGNLIMGVFGLKPGPAVGTVLRYLKENYPYAQEITPELETEVREKALSATG